MVVEALVLGLAIGLGLGATALVAPLVRRYLRRRRWARAVAREPREPLRLTKEELEHAAAIEHHRAQIRSEHANAFVKRYSEDLLQNGVTAHAAMDEARRVYAELMGW